MIISSLLFHSFFFQKFPPEFLFFFWEFIQQCVLGFPFFLEIYLEFFLHKCNQFFLEISLAIFLTISSNPFFEYSFRNCYGNSFKRIYDNLADKSFPFSHGIFFFAISYSNSVEKIIVKFSVIVLGIFYGILFWNFFDNCFGNDFGNWSDCAFKIFLWP